MTNNDEIFVYESSNDIIFEGDNGQIIDLSNNNEWHDCIFTNEPLYEFNLDHIIISYN